MEGLHVLDWLVPGGIDLLLLDGGTAGQPLLIILIRHVIQFFKEVIHILLPGW
jgi:hypothetical protein